MTRAYAHPHPPSAPLPEYIPEPDSEWIASVEQGNCPAVTVCPECEAVGPMSEVALWVGIAVLAFHAAVGVVALVRKGR